MTSAADSLELVRSKAELTQARVLLNLSVEILGLLNEDTNFADTLNQVLTSIKRTTEVDAVGIRLRSGDDFPYHSQNGFSADFLLSENTLVARKPDGDVCQDDKGRACLECTCGLVLSGQTDPTNPLFTPNGSCWLNRGFESQGFPRTDNDPRLNPRNTCFHRGFNSLALIPIRARREIVGLLQLNDRRQDRFTHETIEFLEGLAVSIGLALMRRQADEALRKNEALQRALISNISDVITIIDREGTVRYRSPNIEKLFGWRPEEIVGTNALTNVHPEDHARALELFGSLLTRPDSVASGECRYRCKDGSYRWIAISAVNLLADPEVAGVLLNYHDITDRKRVDQALRDSETKYRNLFNNAGIGMFRSRLDGSKFLESNEKYLSMLGRTREETIGVPSALLWEDPKTREVMVKMLKTTGHVDELECRLARTDGTVIDCITSLMSYPEQGIVEGSILDITQRKRAETALRESEALYRSLVENANEAIYVVQEGGVVFANRVGVELVGYSEREFAIKPFVEFVHPDDRAMVAERHVRRLSGERFESHYSFRLITKQGDVKWVELGGALITYEGKPATLSLINDITARKQAEDTLRNRETQLRAILDMTPFPNALVDISDNDVDFWSHSAAELFGYTPSTTSEWYELAYPDPDYQREVIAQWKSALDQPHSPGQAINTGEYRIACHDGSVRICELYAGFLPDRLIVTFNDITERKQAEDALREQHAELERFTYAVSHDLRSPLVTIKTFLAYLDADLKNSDGPGISKDIAFISNATDKMSLLLDELMHLSRVGRSKNPTEEVSLQVVVKEALDLVAGRLAIHNVTVTVTDEPVLLLGDRRRLVELFQNLLDNAAKFMRTQSSPLVEIGVDSTYRGLLFFVRDNGVGFHPEQQEKLFGLFQRLDPSAEGTGMGLALARRIVQLHGGKLWAESDGPGSGAVFKFTLANARHGKDGEI